MYFEKHSEDIYVLRMCIYTFANVEEGYWGKKAG